MKRKLKLKKKNILLAVLFVLSLTDLLYLMALMIMGATVTWFGFITLIIDTLIITLTSEEIKENIKK